MSPIPGGFGIDPTNTISNSPTRTPTLSMGKRRLSGKKHYIKSIIKSIPAWLKQAFFNNWINLLLVFVPVGIVTHYTGVDPTIVFILNFIALIPLTSLISYATERITGRCHGALADLLNASFGNATELIVSILALTSHEIEVVQTSLIGSTLSNLLLVLNVVFVSNSIEQNITATPCLPALAVSSLIVPTVFHVASSASGVGVTALSRGIAIILFLVYSSFLTFQLKNPHTTASAETLKHHALSLNASTEPEAEPQTPAPSLWAALTLMVLGTVLAAFCAEGLVSSIDHVVTSAGISRIFLGFVLLPVVGSAAEPVRAVTAAVRDKVDLSMVTAVGRTQTVLLAVPFVVVVGWCVGVSETTLYSSGLQAMAVAVLVMGGNYLFQGSQSSEGGLQFDAGV